MNKDGYITPPPGLIPPSQDGATETVRRTARRPALPTFVPASPGAVPVNPSATPANPTAVPTAPSEVVPDVPATEPPVAPGDSASEEAPAVPPVSSDDASASAPAQWSLTLHDGSVIHVSGTLLVGRDPAQLEPWTSAALLRINDPERSVSKTHAVLDCRTDELWLVDLHSTNGVAILAGDGTETVLAPGERTMVPPSSIVELGRYRLGVTRQ